MTAAALAPSIEYLENGVTLAFAVPFRFLSASHLSVSRVLASGAVVVLAQGTDWSATGGSTDAGGTLTLVATVAGSRLRIRRATPRAQQADWETGDRFPAQSIEDAHDKAMLIAQELAVAQSDLSGRALLVPDGETAAALPALAARAGRILSFDGVTGQPETDLTVAAVQEAIDNARAALAGGSATSAVSWTSPGAGAVTRTLHALLTDMPIHPADFGTLDPTGTVDNTAIFVAAQTASRVQRRPIALPVGRFKAGLTFNEDDPDALGWGPTQTVFVPVANGATVITVNRSTSVNRNRNFRFGGFSVDVNGFTGCTCLYTNLLVSSHFSDIAGVGALGDYPSFANFNIGWRSVGDQYSSFDNMDFERIAIGIRASADASAGGLINNSYRNVKTAYNKVGVMLTNTSAFPAGILDFNQLIIQATTHCAFYAYGIQGVRVIGLPPEACTGSGTYVYDGFTIKAGLIHLDGTTDGSNGGAAGSQAIFDQYDHVSNDATMVVTLDNNSVAQFTGAKGARVSFAVDAGSTCEWDGIAGNQSTFGRVKTSLQYQNIARQMYGWNENPEIVYDDAFPNEVTTPERLAFAAFNGASNTLIADAKFGCVRRIVFNAVAGNTTTNRLVLSAGTTSPYTPFVNGDYIMFGVMLRAQTDTNVSVMFAQSQMTAAAVTLKAGVWTRLWMCNKNTSGFDRDYNAVVYTPGADAPTLDVVQAVSFRNPTPEQFRRFTQAHIYNAKTPSGLPEYTPLFATLANGGTTTLEPWCGALVSDTAGTIASHTVTLPSAGIDGQVFEMSTVGAITTLTVNAAAGQSVNGAPATLAASGAFRLRFRASNSTWYRSA